MHGGDVWREGAPGDWLDFSANIRPGGPPDWVRDALLAGIGDVSYYPDLRMERARAALGAYLNLGPDWVLPTAGGISAIALAACLAPEMLVFGPCFSEYAEIAADCGAKVRELSLLAGRDPMPEASLSAAPTSAPRERCERGELSTTSRRCASSAAAESLKAVISRESALFASPSECRELDARSTALPDASRDDGEAGELSAMPCEGAASVAPISAPRESRGQAELSELLCDGKPSVASTDTPREGHSLDSGGATPITAPSDAPRESRGRGELSESLCDGTPSAAPMGAMREGRGQGELSESLCDGMPSAASTDAPREDCNPNESSATLRGRAALAAPMSAPRNGREPGELSVTPYEAAHFAAPTSAPCEGYKPGELSEASREGAPCAAPKGIPLAFSRESASSMAPRDHCELGAHPVASANLPCEDRGPDESPATSCGGASFAAAESLKAVISRESASSIGPRDHRELGAHPVVSANLPCEGRGPNESPATSRGCESSAASSPASLEHFAADAPPPALCDRRALAMPSEVLRGNMTPGAAVWLCNPLNPVGVAFPRAEIEALLGIVEAAGGWLVLDEAFVHCCPERTSADLLAEHPRLAIVGSLTKSLGIPGARAGYVCANPDVLRKLARRQRSWELNCFAESVIRALPDHAAELRAEAETNAARREALRRGLEALGAYVYPSEACFLLADFGRDVSPLVNRLREKGILVRQCTDFHGIDDGCHLRLAVKDEGANGRLIEALREALGAGSC